MALLPSVFIPEENEDMEFKPLKGGWYPAELVKSELKTTKDKKGKYLSFQFKVIEDANDESSEGRFVFTNLKTGHGLDTVIAFILDKGMLS